MTLLLNWFDYIRFVVGLGYCYLKLIEALLKLVLNQTQKDHDCCIIIYMYKYTCSVNFSVKKVFLSCDN